MRKQKQKRYRTEKPHQCDYCEGRFTLRSNMDRHVKQQHPEFWGKFKAAEGLLRAAEGTEFEEDEEMEEEEEEGEMAENIDVTGEERIDETETETKERRQQNDNAENNQAEELDNDSSSSGDEEKRVVPVEPRTHGKINVRGIEFHVDLLVDQRLAVLVVVLPDLGHGHLDSWSSWSLGG